MKLLVPRRSMIYLLQYYLGTFDSHWQKVFGRSCWEMITQWIVEASC